MHIVKPLTDWQEVSSLCRVPAYWLRLFSHHRLLTRGHDLAVLSIMPFRYSRHATLSLTMHSQSVILRRNRYIHTVVKSCRLLSFWSINRYRDTKSTCTFFWHVVVQHICILTIKCVSSPAGNRLIPILFTVRNVLIIAKGTIVRYKRSSLSLSTWFPDQITVLVKVHTTGSL